MCLGRAASRTVFPLARGGSVRGHLRSGSSAGGKAWFFPKRAESEHTQKIFPAEAGRSERRVRRGWSESAADLEDAAPETVVGSVDESGVHRVEGGRACDRTLLSGKISLVIEARILKAEARGIFVAELSAIAEIPFTAVVADV